MSTLAFPSPSDGRDLVGAEGDILGIPVLVAMDGGTIVGWIEPRVWSGFAAVGAR